MANDYSTIEQAFSLGKGQDGALEWLKDTNQTVAVFLISGIKLEGTITHNDQFSILLTDTHGHQQLVYKAKISTVAQLGANQRLAHSSPRDKSTNFKRSAKPQTERKPN
ncbi:MAG: RNA chaperone Hfq [Succinivibrionaceae bacterium]|nr:RNA chaperone Hfq [Succinivibrionaceae bacterium]